MFWERDGLTRQEETAPLPEGLGLPAEDWHQTPVRVRLVVLTLLKRLETLEARSNQNSSNSTPTVSPLVIPLLYCHINGF